MIFFFFFVNTKPTCAKVRDIKNKTGKDSISRDFFYAGTFNPMQRHWYMSDVYRSRPGQCRLLGKRMCLHFAPFSQEHSYSCGNFINIHIDDRSFNKIHYESHFPQWWSEIIETSNGLGSRCEPVIFLRYTHPRIAFCVNFFFVLSYQCSNTRLTMQCIATLCSFAVYLCSPNIFRHQTGSVPQVNPQCILSKTTELAHWRVYD